MAGSWRWDEGAQPAGEQSHQELLTRPRSPALRSPPRPARSPAARGHLSLGTRGRGGLPGRATRSRVAGPRADGSVREGPTYLSARNLSPSSASAIPSKLRPTSRPMAREPGPLARARLGSTAAKPRPTPAARGRAPPHLRPRPVPGPGPRLRPRPGPGSLSPQTYVPRHIPGHSESLHSFTSFPKQTTPQEIWATRLPFSFP